MSESNIQIQNDAISNIIKIKKNVSFSMDKTIIHNIERYEYPFLSEWFVIWNECKQIFIQSKIIEIFGSIDKFTKIYESIDKFTKIYGSIENYEKIEEQDNIVDTVSIYEEEFEEEYEEEFEEEYEEDFEEVFDFEY